MTNLIGVGDEVDLLDLLALVQVKVDDAKADDRRFAPQGQVCHLAPSPSNHNPRPQCFVIHPE